MEYFYDFVLTGKLIKRFDNVMDCCMFATNYSERDWDGAPYGDMITNNSNTGYIHYVIVDNKDYDVTKHGFTGNCGNDHQGREYNKVKGIK